MAQRSAHALIGFDLNATRVRAVGGPSADVAFCLPLDGEHDDLPLALSLQGRHPEVGRAGLALCRRSPHLVCLDFLAHLDAPRQWKAGRHCLDAGQALALVLQRLQPLSQSAHAVAFAVPAYLTPDQVNLVAAAARKARLPAAGTVSAPLASALSAYAERPWFGTAVVVDVDDHALTLMTLTAGNGLAQVLDTRVLPHLNLRLWKERLLAAVADRCIRQSRRDPRDSAVAEQALYENLEEAFDACRQGRMIELVVQTPQWYQNLIFQPEEVVQFCAPLARPVVEVVEAARAASRPNEPPRVVLLTAAAGRLPGLVARLQDSLGEPGPEEELPPPSDFGEALVREMDAEPPLVTVLSAEAAARAAQALAARFLRRELAPGHLGLRAPVPPPQPVESGPARLQFRGQEFLLNRPSFSLGRQPTCDLVFDSDAYPAVSGWHCEIVGDSHSYVLRDRSRHGTLVNDKPVTGEVTLFPGDWIRLGPNGPLLRFLGRGADPRWLTTTA
jgi:hypothetical protein